MGKATIISHIGEGLYNIQIEYNTGYKSKKSSSLDANITALETKLAGQDPDTLEYNITVLQITALNKDKSALQTFPDSKDITAWCADKTENLSGSVGTIEIPGESPLTNIQPGFNSGAEYNKSRDGQIAHTMLQDSAGCYFNLCMLPGWQKWKPLFRYGIISNLDADTCDITLEHIPSSQQGLNINQSSALFSVEIDYMDCHGAAFKDGDEVVVMFGNQDWFQPKVIGFKDNPQPCGLAVLYVISGDMCGVVDLEKMAYKTDVPKNGGGAAVFPILIAEISDWVGARTLSGKSSVRAYVSTNNDPSSLPPGCLTSGYDDIQATTPYCGIETRVWDCSVPQWSPNGTQDYVYFSESISIGGSGYSKTTQTTESFAPFGYASSPGKFVGVSKTNTGGIVYGYTPVTLDSYAVDEQAQYSVRGEPKQVEPCKHPAFDGGYRESETTKAYVFSPPFSDASEFPAIVTDNQSYTEKKQYYDGSIMAGAEECSNNHSEDIPLEHVVYADGVVGTEEGIDPYLISWYSLKFVTQLQTEKCFYAWGQGSIEFVGGCSIQPCSTPTQKGDINIQVDEFHAFFQKADDGTDPNDLSPFEIAGSAVLTGIFKTLLGDDSPEKLHMIFLK